MKSPFILTACVTAFLTMHVAASEITWTAKPYPVEGDLGSKLNTGIFNQSGKLILAENSGGPATTFDGIHFKPGNITFGENWETYHTKHQKLSTTGTWTEKQQASTVQLKGLSPGKTYRIQALIFDGRDDENIIGKTVKFDGIDQGVYANSKSEITWGNGLLVTGIFTADSSGQSFTIETFLQDKAARINETSSQGGQLNAILVHEISGSQKTTAKPRPPAKAKPDPEAIISIGGFTLTVQQK